MRSRVLPVLCATFILAFFLFFSYRGLFSYFTFDDGTTVIVCLKPFETPIWKDLLHIVTVFTPAFRPLTTMFWRPLYAAFGFHPLPYRIVVHLLLILNIGLAYLLARRLEATREAAALTALIFCYNAATSDLYYDTCLVGDITCFLFYGLALVAFSSRPRRTIAVFVCFFLALDSKEMAVTLPGALLLYEILYRRDELRDRRKALGVAGVIAAMLAADALFLKVKVADMSQNAAYAPHVTAGFVLQNIAHYVQQLLYFPEKSLTPLMAFLVLAAIAGLGALLRSRQAIFGVLYFVAALIPIAVIDARGGYAAYVAYFGLALAFGAILASARARLASLIQSQRPVVTPFVDAATSVSLFLCVAVVLGWAHLVDRMPGTRYYEWTTPAVIGLMDGFRQNIPEFPPGARVLIDRDPWQADWGPMFLVRLLYRDNSVWVDRTKNMDHPPDLASYDLVVSYTPPDVELIPARWFRHPVKWEVRSRLTGTGQFLASSPGAKGARAIRSGQSISLMLPGRSHVEVAALCRSTADGRSTPHLVNNLCKLDANGSCTVAAPPSLQVDWIRPAHQRWILVSGTP